MLVIAFAAMTLSGCGHRGSTGVTAPEPLATSTTTASGSVDATSAQDASGSAGSTATGTPKSLNAKDAAAIKSQLDAVEKELDSLGMPSDSDFKQVEDSLK